MKKLLILFLCLVICLSACGSNEPEEILSPESSSSQEEIPKAEEKPTTPKETFTYEIYPVKTWVNSIGTPWAQAIIAITNTADYNLYLSSFSSSLDLETASGSLFATQNSVNAYPQVIAPGETGYYYEEFILNSLPEGELNPNWHLTIEPATVEQIRFPVSDVTLSADSCGYIKAIGRVENTTEEEQSLVFISVMLFDAENKPIGHMATFVDLAPKDKKGFECSALSLPDDISLDDVASYAVVAYNQQYQF